MMKTDTLISALIALVLIAYWAVSSRRAKKERLRRATSWSWIALPIVALLLSANWLPIAQSRLFAPSAVTQWLGVALEISGVTLAVWGRKELGANWSSAAAVKEEHSLVISGPYRVVRHPIYAGFLSGSAGAALTRESVWLIIFALLFAIFTYRIRIEESLMVTEFPHDYPIYQRRTKRLIPFIW